MATSTVLPTPPTPPKASTRTGKDRRSAFIVLIWLAVVIAGGISGGLVFDRLSSSTDPGVASESQQARRAIEAATGESDTVVALITGASDAAPDRLAATLRDISGVYRVRSSAQGQLPQPESGGTLLAIGIRAEQGDRADIVTVDAIKAVFDKQPAGTVLLGGYPVINRELGATAESDMVRAEVIAIPIVLILLGIAVRSVVGTAIATTLVVTTVTGALALLLGLSELTAVSSFAINVVTMFGMGLAVDYGLLIITRFRRERSAGTPVANAVAATMATSGRTVAFSGLTVAVALVGLLVFAEPVVRSMAYGGIGAVAVAITSTLTLLPVLLRRFGHRIPASVEHRDGGFARLARLVQRRPLFVATGTLLVLAALAAPLTGLRLQGLDVRALPGDSVARRDTVELERRLPAVARTPVNVVVDIEATDTRLPSYIEKLRGIDGVLTATVRPDVVGTVAIVDLTVNGSASGRDAMRVVEDVRATRPGFGVKVGGLAARNTDFIESTTNRIPYAALLVALTTFLVLLVVTGGVIIAATAVLMNLASLCASLGALVWTFQSGHLSDLLGFTATGGVELVIVVLTAVFSFGLSTDYEVFLLSSVMAAHRESRDTDAAVATGISRTGRIITTAAVLIIVVFAGFAAGDLLIVKQLGVGLSVAVLLDATLIRLGLTPAIMTMFRERNWAGPAWARRTSEILWRHEI